MQLINIISVLVLISGISSKVGVKLDATFDGKQYSISAACRPIHSDFVYNCGTTSDLFQISKVTFNPARPQKGQKFHVIVEGTVKDTIPQKSVAHITAKFGSLTVFDKDTDFCKSIEGTKVKCPIKKGHHIISKVVNIPSILPDGSYFIDTVAKTPNNKQIFHVQVKAVFKS